MTGLTFKSNYSPIGRTRVVFDTNAYRNFVEHFLTSDANFVKTIQRIKKCEGEAFFEASSNLFAVMELYQHLKPGDPAYERCKKAILFSFNRSISGDSLKHQPLAEIEISDRLFGKLSDADTQLNGYLFNGHVNFCLSKDKSNIAHIEFADNVTKRLDLYKENSYNGIVSNLQRLFPSVDSEHLKFSIDDFKMFKAKFGDRLKMYVDLGTSLFDTFQKRLNITNYNGDKASVIGNIITDYQPAFFSYIKIWENFSHNNPNSKGPFKPNKNDLIDSLILYSIVPDDNILLVTDEKKIHSIFREIDRPTCVSSLSDYLKKINFIP